MYISVCRGYIDETQVREVLLGEGREGKNFRKI